VTATNYNYQAYDAAGKVQSGQLSAESERDAIRVLQNRQLTPVKISVADGRNSRGSALTQGVGKRIRAADLLDFTTGLRTLVEARVPLDKALRLLEGITESAAMQTLVATLRKDVKEGKSLAEAMESRPDVFSRMYINIVRAGEEGGILHQLLPDLAEFLETSAKNRQAMIAAMIYPIVLLFTGVVSVFLLLVFVIPQFAIMFEDAGSDVPASAAFLLALSDGIKRYGWLVLATAGALVFWWRWQDRAPETLLAKHAFLLRLPMLGQLILYRECAVFARTLGALLGAGIPLIRALRVAREVVG
jgi:general secretion pathway protein F